jgi:hypothetical protein
MLPESIMPSTKAVEQDAELERMHTLYRQGGLERGMAPHIVYVDEFCPYGCGQRMQAIDFRVEAYGPTVHDPLVRAWWNDIGFAGKCPNCGGWIHFTIRAKQAISEDEAAALPKLPEDWHKHAVIL